MKALYIEDDFIYSGGEKRKLILRVIIGYSDYGILLYLKDLMRFLHLKSVGVGRTIPRDQIVTIDYDMVNIAFGSFFKTHRFQRRRVRFATEDAALHITKSLRGSRREMLYNYLILLFERLNRAYNEVYVKNGYPAIASENWLKLTP